MHLDLLTTALSSDEPELSLNPRQFDVFTCPSRFRVLVAGRRFGKTELALVELFRAATSAPNRLVWYIGPSDKLAKDIMWDRLKEVTRRYWAAPPNETTCRIQLFNGSVLVVKGAFNPNALRGKGLDFVVLDEVADLRPETWSHALRPALADRQGRALFIGTPQGRNHLFQYFENALTNPDWQSFHFTTEEGGLIEAAELESAGRDMDYNTFRQEFNAEFTAAGKYRTYLAFDRAANVCEVSYQNYLPLVLSIDFNVDPMCLLFMQRITEDIRVFEEHPITPDATTEKACHIILERLKYYYHITDKNHVPLQVHVYGDASGGQRHTSCSATDWVQIRDFFRPYRDSFELHFQYALANPLQRDRVNCVNARLRNKHGEARMFISPKCRELIRDLEEVSWQLDAFGAPMRQIDKSDPKRTHMSDALGYFVSQIFPLMVPGKC